jgi:5'-methylthioadenosine phosphorylase
MIEIGFIGGSGLYDLPGLTKQEWVTVDTPFGAPSDQYLTGEIAGRRVAFLPRHGRGHRLLPGELSHRANILGFRQLGVRRLVSLSAVGSLKEELAPGVFVCVDQFYDRTKRGPEHTFFGDGIVAHIGFSHPVCSELAGLAHACAAATGPAVNRGTYVNMEGPAFSTLAEANENRRAGFDVIGMTNLGEAKCAREAEICYASVAMVTDYDCWHEEHGVVSVEVIVKQLHENAGRARELVAALVPRIPAAAACSCQSALKSALFTPRNLWPAATVERLRPILAPYLDTP